MAEKKINLVEEALLQMKNLEGVLSRNAKGMLASTMKQEISELVKESLNDEVEDEIVYDETNEQVVSGSEEDDLDMDSEEMDMDSEEMDMDSEEMDMDSEEMDMDSEEMDMDSEEMDMDSEEMDMDSEEMDMIEPLDLTKSSDDEVLKVFKAMGEEDGIIVRRDGDEIYLTDENTGVEYSIYTESEEEEMDMDSEEMDEEFEEDEEEVIYEIEVEDDEFETEDDEFETEDDEFEMINTKGDEPLRILSLMDSKDDNHGETMETQTRSHSNGRRNVKKPASYPKFLKRPSERGTTNESLKKEMTQLREKNEEYRKALNIFKEKLNEVAVFNSNLAYATRLFTEHSTTKQEKINILRRFDSINTIKESKNLYKTIKDDLGGKETKVATESVSTKVDKNLTKGSSTNLIESKTYENPQFLRIKDLMNKIN